LIEAARQATPPLRTFFRTFSGHGCATSSGMGAIGGDLISHCPASANDILAKSKNVLASLEVLAA
jgi:hypothetical protein